MHALCVPLFRGPARKPTLVDAAFLLSNNYIYLSIYLSIVQPLRLADQMALVSANSARGSLHQVRSGSMGSSEDPPSLLVIVGPNPYKSTIVQIQLGLILFVPSVIVFLLYVSLCSVSLEWEIQEGVTSLV